MEKLSDNLINAVRRLVEEKRHIDKLGAKGFKWIVGDLVYDRQADPVHRARKFSPHVL